MSSEPPAAEPGDSDGCVPIGFYGVVGAGRGLVLIAAAPVLRGARDTGEAEVM